MLTLVTGTGATMRVVSPDGARDLSPGQFFAPGGGTTLAPGDILTAIRFPPAAAFTSVTFEKFRQRTFDAAVASVLCALRAAGGTVAAARITAGAVFPVPRAAARTSDQMTGAQLSSPDPAAIADQVATELFPAAEPGSTDEYHRELIRALARTALAGALTSAGS